MTVIVAPLLLVMIVLILGGHLVPRCSPATLMTSDQSAPYYYFDFDGDGNVRMTETTVGAIQSCVTLEQVLEWLPTWMRADFDCPRRGPHDWLWTVPKTSFNAYGFCRNCNRVKRGSTLAHSTPGGHP